MRYVDSRWRTTYAAGRLKEFGDQCRKSGLALTPQRLAIFRALLASSEHPRAEEIFARVREEQPTISLATVHRTLEALCDMGEARKVTPLHVSARYDGNLSDHHHVVCVQCGRVCDVEAPEFSNLLHGRSVLGDFTLVGYSVEIRALCKPCRAKGAAKSHTHQHG